MKVGVVSLGLSASRINGVKSSDWIPSKRQTESPVAKLNVRWYLVAGIDFKVCVCTPFHNSCSGSSSFRYPALIQLS